LGVRRADALVTKREGRSVRRRRAVVCGRRERGFFFLWQQAMTKLGRSKPSERKVLQKRA
jgi:hypothetical protein